MSTEQNKALVRRLVDASVASDQAALKELLAPDFVAYQTYGTQDREAFLQHLNGFLVAFSDNHFTVEEQVAEGDKVVTRTTWHATHSSDFQGLPPTGKQIAISGITIERIKDGKIVERWASYDMMGLMQQLGVVPPPQPAR